MSQKNIRISKHLFFLILVVTVWVRLDTIDNRFKSIFSARYILFTECIHDQTGSSQPTQKIKHIVVRKFLLESGADTNQKLGFVHLLKQNYLL